MSGRLPTFIIIGAQKSATRWLRDVLGQHPDVFTADRELEFFNHHYGEGLGWYSQKFMTADDEAALGEATPGYMMWTDDPRRTAARIDGTLPNVRLIALLRNPIERMTSAFIHHARMGRLDDSVTLAEYIGSTDPETDPLGLVSGSWYARSLMAYRERFGDRLLVLLQDHARSDPGALYGRALAHIGVAATYRPPSLATVRHSNRPNVDDWVIAASELAPTERSCIFREHLAQDVERLAKDFDLNLRAWRPEEGSSPGE